MAEEKFIDRMKRIHTPEAEAEWRRQVNPPRSDPMTERVNDAVTATLEMINKSWYSHRLQGYIKIKYWQDDGWERCIDPEAKEYGGAKKYEWEYQQSPVQTYDGYAFLKNEEECLEFIKWYKARLKKEGFHNVQVSTKPVTVRGRRKSNAVKSWFTCDPMETYTIGIRYLVYVEISW